jgi:hypothetical protein
MFVAVHFRVIEGKISRKFCGWQLQLIRGSNKSSSKQIDGQDRQVVANKATH